MLGRHDLGDDRQARLGAGGGQHLEAQLLVSLEAVRAGPRLERAAAQAGGAQRLELAGQADDLLLVSRPSTGPAITATRVPPTSRLRVP